MRAASTARSYSGKIVTSGSYVAIRVQGLDPQSLYQQALDYVRVRGLPWNIKPPRSWSQDSGPYITLNPKMRKYLGLNVSGIRLGEPYHLEFCSARWVMLAVTLPSAYKCDEYECHLPIGQEVE